MEILRSILLFAVAAIAEIDVRHIRTARYTFRIADASAIAPVFFEKFGELFVWGLPTAPGHWASGVVLPDEHTQMSRPVEDVNADVLSMLQRHFSEHLDQVDPNPVSVIPCSSDGNADGFFACREGPVLAIWGDNLFKFAPILGSALASAIVEMTLPNLPLVNG